MGIQGVHGDPRRSMGIQGHLYPCSGISPWSIIFPWVLPLVPLLSCPLQTLQADHGDMCDAFVTHFKLRFLEIIFSLCHLDVANIAHTAGGRLFYSYLKFDSNVQNFDNNLHKSKTCSKWA